MTLTTVKHYGAIAKAMAQVQVHKPRVGEVSGAIGCTACGSVLRFTIWASGFSRGGCTRGPRCVNWAQ